MRADPGRPRFLPAQSFPFKDFQRINGNAGPGLCYFFPFMYFATVSPTIFSSGMKGSVIW